MTRRYLRHEGEPWRAECGRPRASDDHYRCDLADAAVRTAARAAARQIQDHTLAVGARLPTIRRLAVDLGLAVNTVGRAYRELEEAGLIETRGRAGSFVSAAGEEGRERARRAAADYAAVVASVGSDAGEAIRIVQAALTSGLSAPAAP